MKISIDKLNSSLGTTKEGISDCQIGQGKYSDQNRKKASLGRKHRKDRRHPEKF